MKKKLLVILPSALVVFLLVSCGIVFQDSVTGNGKVVSEKREITEFNILNVTSALEVIVDFGGSPSLEIEADENLMDMIKTELRNDQLKIYTERNIRKAKSKIIYLTVPTLSAIEVSGAANVHSRNSLKAKELEIEVSSAGKLTLSAETEKMQIEVSSAGVAELEGSTDDLELEVSSAGKLEAGDLVSKNCDAEVSSAGHVEVNVQLKLDAEASSAGRISYSGDPKEKRIETSSAGSVSAK